MNRIEELFGQTLEAVECLQEALNVSLVDALVETFDNLESGEIRVEMGAPDQKTVAELEERYAALDYKNWSKAQKEQVYGLLVLKAVNDDGRDANQMPTPPLLATVLTLFMDKLLPKRKQVLLDPAVGSGNLLFSVDQQLAAQNHSEDRFDLVGLDNDEEMLNLADVAAHLAGLKADFYCQDALTGWPVKPDVVVSDLPIGFYANDDNAKNFDLRTKEGHAYAHVLFVEQIVKNLAEDGFAFLLVPQNMLTGTVGADFMPWLASKVYLQAIVQLPSSLFQSKISQKSILIFQNHGQSKPPKEVLLTKLENLKKEESLVALNIKLNEWYTKKDN
ncbi:class I SAM-dependent methyltransferase [Lactobacillus delbrueckii]|uniref:class I SAM-dependent methyltransferase n=1 Tax=Lactobacillus delbrueckii TaxID=1584 RepID=UPI0000E5558B|nr:class I SAM-dependent methyltransferase [Lactobacillus delbrueckii]ABJ58247.1 Adenine-specific DNA methylase [Lactobacillus delbrueckii subsp. bulgaricus ATCC BAA-365]MBT8937550.1 DNA methyltransferase [Lactobacillus delbrueckii subsp. bulgaricus]RHX67274.1 class I SAM-dependent methyltransferase [Lactobacillus delbrueckii]